MKKALLFKEGKDSVLISAEDIKNGLYSRDEGFVDPEYEIKLQYVSGARNNGGPYFRLYYSYEEFKKLYPDRISKYEILANMRHYEESKWHKLWKERFSEFCEIEKYTKNPATNKWKYADAFYEKYNTCIEFQHSYIALEFEERNKFYSELSINTIWLYDLPRANIKNSEDGYIDILEDNARGFFRISEDPENLKNHRVYIQTKSGMIYRVKELLRRESSTNHKSTIRYFKPTEVYTEEEFVEAVKSNTFKDKNRHWDCKTLQQLWKKEYKWMIVGNIETEAICIINRNNKDEMFRDFKSHCIKFKYIDNKTNKEYHISHEDEKRPIWVFIKAQNK